MFDIPEPNPYWLIAIYATAILVGLLALVTFLLIAEWAVSSTMGAIGVRVRWPKRQKDLPNVEPVDPHTASQLQAQWEQFRPSAKVLPMTERRPLQVEVKW